MSDLSDTPAISTVPTEDSKLDQLVDRAAEITSNAILSGATFAKDAVHSTTAKIGVISDQLGDLATEGKKKYSQVRSALTSLGDKLAVSSQNFAKKTEALAERVSNALSLSEQKFGQGILAKMINPIAKGLGSAIARFGKVVAGTEALLETAVRGLNPKEISIKALARVTKLVHGLNVAVTNNIEQFAAGMEAKDQDKMTAAREKYAKNTSLLAKTVRKIGSILFKDGDFEQPFINKAEQITSASNAVKRKMLATQLALRKAEEAALHKTAGGTEKISNALKRILDWSDRRNETKQQEQAARIARREELALRLVADNERPFPGVAQDTLDDAEVA